MAELVYVSGDRVKHRQRPLVLLMNDAEIQMAVEVAGMNKAAIVQFPGGVFGVYSMLQIEPAEDQATTPNATVETVADVVDREISQMVKTPQPKPESDLSRPTPIGGKWVKPTPALILPNAELKCISGSNAGRTARVRNVVRPGKADGQTLHLVNSTDGSVARVTDGNSTVANKILNSGEMRMYSLGIPQTDNVVIEWDAPKTETTKQNTVVNGVKLNSREVSAPMTHANMPKGRICSDFLIWQPA